MAALYTGISSAACFVNARTASSAMYRMDFVREVNSLHYAMVIKDQCWGPTGALTNNSDLGFERIKADVQNIKIGYFTLHSSDLYS